MNAQYIVRLSEAPRGYLKGDDGITFFPKEAKVFDSSFLARQAIEAFREKGEVYFSEAYVCRLVTPESDPPKLCGKMWSHAFVDDVE